MDRKKNEKQPELKDELWETMQNVWNNLPMENIQKLQESTPKWIPAGLHENVVTSKNEISLISLVTTIHFCLDETK